MKKTNPQSLNKRRTFLKQFAAGAAVLSTGMLAAPFQLSAAEFGTSPDISEADEWFKQVKGKHRIVFDVPAPNGSLPFAWPRVFLLSNAKTGSAESDCGVVVILRHNAIPYAFGHDLWGKYKFGEMFKIDDDVTKTPATKNPSWQPVGTMKIPGLGEVKIGINDLQASGVMFCACDVAITVHCARIAEQTKQDATAIKNEWLANLLPGIQVAPSGIWAVGRAQEHGCAYCFAG